MRLVGDINSIVAKSPIIYYKEISKIYILSLPIELLYDILDYLPVEDIVSFVVCRWDIFVSSVEFLRYKVGLTVKNLNDLITLFVRYY